MPLVNQISRQILFAFLDAWTQGDAAKDVACYAKVENALLGKIQGLPRYMLFAFSCIACYVAFRNILFSGQKASTCAETRHLNYLKTKHSLLPPVRDFCLFIESFAVLYWSEMKK
ncbi:MAG: hypothetical protein AAGE59_26540 [Cyanobacteria bacterium P01_F01_bin.86]